MIWKFEIGFKGAKDTVSRDCQRIRPTQLSKQNPRWLPKLLESPRFDVNPSKINLSFIGRVRAEPA